MAASPIYFLAKYFTGLDLVNKDGVTYILKPQMQYLQSLTAHFRWEAMELCVWSGMERFWKSHRMPDGGILELGEQKLSLVRGETRRVKI